MFLLETDLLLDLRRGAAGGCSPELLNWISSHPGQRLFVSAIALIELERGASEVRRRGPLAVAEWRRWLDDQLGPAFEGRVLPIDAAVARRQATLPLDDPRDALLAATALEHGLTLATYHPRQFRGARVKTFDPRTWSAEYDGDWRAATGTGGAAWLRNLFIR